jgi:alkanesulfonate monooxygenase SsuD/methylene tetrahydromethanopterin reductase-like flavin-dependent oxidoreductase (luciferase family)
VEGGPRDGFAGSASGGRFVLGVGLGDPAQWEYGFFGEETDARVRAAKLDEGLAILAGLWTGEPSLADRPGQE